MLAKKSLALLVLCAAMASARPAAADVQLTINGGRVSLSAKNATVSQILAEWARVGQTKIVNAERVSGGPLTLELTNVPEAEAIEIVLRSAGGFLLAPRRVESANTSRFDRILILPPSVPVTSAPRVAVAPPPPQSPRPFTVPQPGQLAVPQPGQQAVSPGVQVSSDDNDDPADRPNAPAAGVQPPRVPVFNTFPQSSPQRAAPPPSTAPTSSVTAPVGVAVPGMVPATPQPANQPGTIAPPQQQPR